MTHPARIAEVARKHRLAKARRVMAKQAAEVIELRAEADQERVKARMAERAAAQAFDRAFKELVNQKDQIEYLLNRMSDEMVRAYGPKLAEEAQKLLALGDQYRRPFFPSFSAREVMDEVKVVELTGEIPAFRYHHKVALW